MGNNLAAEELQKLSVLYVEDDEGIREEVAHFLERRVARLATAANGEEGLKAFQTDRPDIVLTDIQMPVMDGLTMTAAIRGMHAEVAVIVITAFEDTEYFQKAIDVGVDGYVLKPVRLERLLDAMHRCVVRLLAARELTAGRARLAAYHEAAEEERTLVAELMAKMMRPDNLRDSQVQYWLRPAETIGGDLVAVARTRSNRLYVMVADSTGHGLPAALNLLPVNHIFYRMVAKNLPVSLIVEELNWAVREQSPTERYVSVMLAAFDSRNRVVEVWNGGMPPLLLVTGDGEVQHRFESRNFPLGVLDRTLVAETEIVQWSSPAQLVMYSDGLEDAEDEQGTFYGSERILKVLRESAPADRFADVKASVEAHLGERNALDDVTLVVVAGGETATTA